MSGLAASLEPPTVPRFASPTIGPTARRELDSLAYIASHDLQEPLRRISLCVDGLREIESLPDDALPLLGVLHHATATMRTLVSAVRRYASVTVETHLLMPADPEVLAQRAGLLLEQAGGTLTVLPIPLVDADPELLEVVFRELFLNAAAFSGGEAPHVTVTGGLEVDLLRIRVEDTGPGVAPSVRDRMFEPFARCASSSGIGTGLTLARRIVEEHGGELLLCDEALCRGTAFDICLPLRSAEDYW